MNQHIKMMQLAEAEASQSECAERQVGGALVMANDTGLLAGCNSPKTDDTNHNHVEAILLDWAMALGWRLQGATLYVTCRPCARCTDLLAGQGLSAVYYRDAQPEMGHLDALVQEGVKVDSGWIAGQCEPLIEPDLMQKIQASWLARWAV